MTKRVQRPVGIALTRQRNTIRDTPRNDAIIHGETALQRRIRDRLSELNMTAKEAALAADAPAHVVAAALRRPSDLPPDDRDLLSIAKALGTSVSWLIDGRENPQLSEELPETIDIDLHAKATSAAIQSLETAGLVLDPHALSQLILHLYKRLEVSQRA